MNDEEKFVGNWVYPSIQSRLRHCFDKNGVSLCKKYTDVFSEDIYEPMDSVKCKTCSKKLAKIKEKQTK